ncbi:cupredoxin domain-containing protein [Streptacidiphilus jiangxiensis]|uniref:Plastocyanin n=1 Tax=Streptacidiphilus jiangxiensis TaxID=235985 RepID=A0A1H7WB92_STRJI|nr:cupredoxin domain-containing protein [Streptacidiphilus jiangxiensis]SEM18349.1 Plastocyanin [Streptacidiphilus jiangxiensis]
MPRVPLKVALPAAVLILAAGGCSSAAVQSTPTPATPPSTPSAPSSPGPPSARPSAATAQIVIDNFAFSPANLTVHAGESITVVNHDSTTHTLTARPGSAFDTGPVNPGQSATFTAPATPGTYPYVCTIHASMHGTLTVH